MKFKGTKKFNVEYHTTMHLPYKYIISDIQETDKEAEANALLISKAPEMLDMLGKCIDMFLDLKHDKNLPELQEIQDELEQLIKAATKI